MKLTFSKYLLFAILLSMTALLQQSCQKDDDDCCVELGGEVITTVILTFTDPTGMSNSVFTFSDLDGPGGQVPVIDPVVLSANTTYEMSIDFVDNSDLNNPVFITDEVRDEADEHLVCFSVSGAVPQPVIKDQDPNGDPLGLFNEVQTAGTGTGDLTIILKHDPSKRAANPCTTGETDIEATFTVEVF